LRTEQAPTPSPGTTTQPALAHKPSLTTAPAPIIATPQSQETASPPAKTETVAPASSGIDLPGLWGNIIEAVGRVSPFARTYLLEAHPVSLAKNVFTIGFDPEFADHLGLVDNQKNKLLIQTKLQELGHPNVQVKFILAEAPKAPATSPVAAAITTPAPSALPPAAAPTPAAQAKPQKAPAGNLTAEDFKNDPLIQKALEIFKGQIVEVRS
jgi:DNA polymerase-3 subunit gamma/tau